MVQRPIIFPMCTTEHPHFRLCYSKSLNSDYAHCHLPAEMAFVDFTPHCG